MFLYNSFSVSGDNNGHDVCEEDIWGEPHYSALYRYQRPGSRALSLPTMTLFGEFIIFNRMLIAFNYHGEYSILIYGTEPWTVSKQSGNNVEDLEMWIHRRIDCI